MSSALLSAFFAASLATLCAASLPAILQAPEVPCPAGPDPPQPVLVPSTDSCRQFYLCSHGAAYLLTCPAGLYFNADTDRCDYPSNVNCTEPTDPAPTAPTSAPATASSPTRDHPSTQPSNLTLLLERRLLELVQEDLCPESDGMRPVFFPNPANCSSYFMCDNGVAHLMPCPAGLYFNNATWTCDFQQNVECMRSTASPVNGADEDVQQFLESLSLLSEAGGEEASGCPETDGDFPVFLPNPANCSTFFECSHGQPYLHVCPDHLLFNNNTWTCDFSYNVKCVTA